MKKKKKSVVALLTRRKRFRSVFIVRWLIVLVVSIIACLVIRDKIINEAFSHEAFAFRAMQNSILNAINKENDDWTEEFHMNYIKYIMAMEMERGTASILYDYDTGEVIADCEERMYAWQKREGKSSLIYTCDTKDLEGWDEYSKEVADHLGKYDYAGDIMEISHIYINGVNFIPGEFTVNAKAGMIYKDDEEVIYSQKFDEPKDLSSDYEKQDLDEEWHLWMIYGHRENDLSPYVTNYKSYEYMEKLYKRCVENHTLVGSSQGTYGDYEFDIIDSTVITLQNGQKAVLLVARYYDGWVQYGKQFIIGAVAVFFAGLLLAFAWAKIAYMKLKAQYDMEDYRKTLMNTMAHDLKSPLMSISGYAENLKDNVNTDKKDHYAQAIIGNVSHMNRIIESVLTLGKVEDNKVKLNKKPTNLVELVNRCDENYKLLRKDKKQELKVEGEGVFNIDESLFEHVIDNLLSNAVKYANEESTIRVVINENSLSVINKCDTALETDVSALCEPFVVGNENRSDKTGSGLGLAIVKNICALHKFKLEIKYEENEFVAKINMKK